MSGSVTVDSGAAIPEASVSIKDLATGAARTASSGTNGVYNLPALPPGNYEITVSEPGFVTQVWTGISISAGSVRLLNIILHPGNPEVVVRSVAPSVPISESSACCGGSVGSSTVRDTPLNGRDWAQLASLQAGVTGVQTGSATGGGNTDRGFGAPVSVSGARPDQNSYRLDGISINDYSNAAPGSVLGDNLGIDAVEQVSVLGSNYPAEYGRTSGGVINAVTRSGSNAFHGDVYEFLRNSALDARNFFDGPVIPPFKRNQFGVSAGIPVQKGRTFIFGDYEGLRQSLGATTVDTVPSRAIRGIGPDGNASVPAVLCSIPQTAQQDPPNGCTPTQIPASGPGSAFHPDPATHLDTSVLSFLGAFYPLPNGPLLGNGDTGIFTFAAQQVTNENYFTIRLDHKFSEHDTFYGTYMRDNSKTVQPDNFDQLFSDIISTRQVATLHEQHTFNPNFLNSARFGFNRAVGVIGGVSSVLNPNMLDPSFAFEPGRFAGVVQSVPGITDFSGAPATPGKLPNFKSVTWNSFQGGDDAFLTRGIHALKFGFVVERMQNNQLSLYPANGLFTFDSVLHFLINQPRAFQGTAATFVPDVGTRETLVGTYAQDDIRLRRNLTFNAGLRYEIVTSPTEAHDVISNLPSLTAAVPRVGGALFSNPTLRNFEPRLGLAWNPREGKTLIRSGFGIFDVLPLPYEFNQSFSREVPFVQSLIGSTLAAGAFPSNAYQQLKGVTTSGLATSIETRPKRNYVMQWNLSLARELASTLALTVGYVGSRGVHLPYRVNNIDMVLPTLSPAGYLFPLPPVGQTLNPNFAHVDATLYQANSFYHALQADLAKRLGHGVEFHAAYTWGKSIDTLSATESDDAFPNGLLNQLFFDQRTSRGLSDFNVGQNLVVNFTWELPSKAWKSKMTNWALGGWQFVGLYKASSGQPFTPILGGDPVGTKLDETGEHPDLIAGCNPIDANFKKNPNGPIYINANCFALPMATPAIAAKCQTFGFRAPGTNGSTDPGSAGITGTCANLWGNLGRNTMIGPGVSNLDFSAIKNSPLRRISETFNVQFRTEFFNILNRANFASPTNNFTMFDQQGSPVADAGLLTSTQTTSRQIQFALKFIW